MTNLKSNNLVFPLCLLSYNNEKNNKFDKYNLIMDCSIVRWAKIISGKLGDEGIDEYEDKIDEYFEELNGEDNTKNTSVIGYDESNLHKCIIIACIELGINIYDISATIREYDTAQAFINKYEGNYGNDALVKLHKNLLFDVVNNKFNERYFKIYCAIISLIGKKKYRKITVNEIRYRMNGYKKKEIFEIEKETNKNIEILTDSQITTITKKLKKYNFLDRETVKRRFTYYSKKLRGEKFRKALIDDLAKRKFAKEKAKIDSLNIDMLIDKEVKNKLQAEYESIKMNDKEKIIFQN